MKAIILAAGRGSRTGALSDERPKCLLELGGKPLIGWQFDSLRAAGIDEIAVVRGYKAEALSFPGVKAFDNPRWAATNMVMSLACAEEWLSRHDCLVCYADIVYSPDAARRLLGAPGALSVIYNLDWLRLWQLRFADPLLDAETLKVAPDGRLLEIGRKTRDLSEIQGQYMGLLKFTPAAWAAVAASLAGLPPEKRDRLDMTSLLQRLLEGGFRIDTVAASGQWLEVDTAEDFALYGPLIGDAGKEVWEKRFILGEKAGY